MFGGNVGSKMAQMVGQAMRNRQGGAAQPQPQQGGWASRIGQAIQQRRQQGGAAAAPPTVGGGAGSMMRPGRLAGYADGGKVINRKPNGKGC